MAQNRTDNFSVNAPKDIDQRKLKNGNTPYVSVDEAHSLITYKYRTLTCIVMNAGVPTEYWYRDATASSADLVVKNTTTISSVTGLQTELDSKALTSDLSDVALTGSFLDLVDAPTYAAVATTGSYNDLSAKPTIPAAQVNSNWNSTSGVSSILNKPTLSTVAVSGSYNDLADKPVIGGALSTTSDLDEGSNLYFTSARVVATPLTGFSSTTGSLSSSDTVLTAINKLNGNVAAKQNAITTGTSSQYLKGNLTLGTLATVATTGVYTDLTGKPTLSTVATSGAYTDLSGKPTLSTVATTGVYSDLTGRPSFATVAISGAYSDLTGTPDISLKANIASPTLTGTPLAPTATASTNTTQIATTAHVFAQRTVTATLTNKTLDFSANTASNIPASALLSSDTVVFDPATKQDVLVSGTNIKTVNGTSLLGSGDVSAGSGTGGAGDISVQLAALGAPIKYLGVGSTYFTDENQSMTNNINEGGAHIFTAIYLPAGAVITGLKYRMKQAGVYTATNYNGIGLYSVTGSTLTLLKQSANIGTLWAAVANSIVTTPFTSTYTVPTAGIYYTCAVFFASAVTTYPQLITRYGGFSPELNAGSFSGGLFINGVGGYSGVIVSSINLTDISKVDLPDPVWVAAY
jgi:hypothetical protein